jgi:predicted nucleic acid-binding protein
MIALDTSSLVAYLGGDDGDDIDAVEIALRSQQAVLPPVVLCELLSDPTLPASASRIFRQLPILPVVEGFWERAGLLRARLIAKGRKAKLADVLIAQVCLDSDLPLITRDRDFQHFVPVCNLRLLP